MNIENSGYQCPFRYEPRLQSQFRYELSAAYHAFFYRCLSRKVASV